MYNNCHCPVSAVSRPDDDGGVSVGAAAGITVSMLMIVAVTLFVWLWKRHWVLPKCSCECFTSLRFIVVCCFVFVSSILRKFIVCAPFLTC